MSQELDAAIVPRCDGRSLVARSAREKERERQRERERERESARALGDVCVRGRCYR